MGRYSYGMKDTDYRIYEKESEVGGLCRSRRIDGFMFDRAVHAIYSQDEYATALIKKLLNDNLLSQTRSSWIYSRGVLTLYPFQANTFGLPIEVVKDCILGFVEAKYSGNESRRSANFEEWIYSTFGKGIAEHFMIPFNRKLWATDLKEIGTRWIGRRIPQPDLEEVLEGALSNQRKRFGPNDSFWYPRCGGIEALPRAFLPHVGNINLDQEVSAIYPDERRIVMADGCLRRYDKLISSLPLPKLIDMIDSVPISVQKASRQLKYNRVYSVNIGVNRANISNAHWIYFPEQKFVFHRISFPMNFSPSMVPEGASSVTAEISASASKKISEHGLVQRVIDDLILARILEKDDEILVTDLVRLDPAYVIYNHSHNKSVSLIHQFLCDREIYPCGRFGMWEYYNMDHAILTGKLAADRVNREFV